MWEENSSCMITAQSTDQSVQGRQKQLKSGPAPNGSLCSGCSFHMQHEKSFLPSLIELSEAALSMKMHSQYTQDGKLV